MDAHITQYTLYITDIYTGNIFERNVTETRFTFNASDDGTCPMYQVSAWNTGGEGELSEPVHGCRPRSKLATSLLKGIMKKVIVLVTSLFFSSSQNCRWKCYTYSRVTSFTHLLTCKFPI